MEYCAGDDDGTLKCLTKTKIIVRNSGTAPPVVVVYEQSIDKSLKFH